MTEHIPHFELQFSFSSEVQMNRAAIMFLEDDLFWSFTVTPIGDSADRHTLEIHDMPWAFNAMRAGEIVEKACALEEQSDE